MASPELSLLLREKKDLRLAMLGEADIGVMDVSKMILAALKNMDFDAEAFPLLLQEFFDVSSLDELSPLAVGSFVIELQEALDYDSKNILLMCAAAENQAENFFLLVRLLRSFTSHEQNKRFMNWLVSEKPIQDLLEEFEVIEPRESPRLSDPMEEQYNPLATQMAGYLQRFYLEDELFDFDEAIAGFRSRLRAETSGIVSISQLAQLWKLLENKDELNFQFTEFWSLLGRFAKFSDYDVSLLLRHLDTVQSLESFIEKLEVMEKGLLGEDEFLKMSLPEYFTFKHVDWMEENTWIIMESQGWVRTEHAHFHDPIGETDHDFDYLIAEFPFDEAILLFNQEFFELDSDTANEEITAFFRDNFGTEIPKICLIRRKEPLDPMEDLGALPVSAGWTGFTTEMLLLYRYGDHFPTVAELALIHHPLLLSFPSSHFGDAITTPDISSGNQESTVRVLKQFARNLGLEYQPSNHDDLLKRMFASPQFARFQNILRRIFLDSSNKMRLDFDAMENIAGHSRAGEDSVLVSALEVTINALDLMGAKALPGNMAILKQIISELRSEVETGGPLNKSMLANFVALERLVIIGSAPGVNRLKLIERLGGFLTSILVKDESLGNAEAQIVKSHAETIKKAYWLAVASVIGLLGTGYREGYPLEPTQLLRNFPFMVLAEEDALSVLPSLLAFINANFDRNIHDMSEWSWPNSAEELKAQMMKDCVLILPEVGHYAFVGKNIFKVFHAWWDYLDKVRYKKEEKMEVLAEMIADEGKSIWFVVAPENIRNQYLSVAQQVEYLSEQGEGIAVLTPLELLKIKRMLVKNLSKTTVEEIYAEKQQILESFLQVPEDGGKLFPFDGILRNRLQPIKKKSLQVQ